MEMSRDKPREAMRILYDYQAFLQDFGGISRYFYELIQNLDEDGSTVCQLPPMLSNNEYIRGAKFFRHLAFFEGKRFRGKGRIMSSINGFLSTKSLARGNFDVFHPTYYNPYFLDEIGTKPYVLTVYDMIHEIFPQFFSGSTIREWKKVLVEKATKIVAISHSTKKDLVEILNVPPDKIEVIWLGSSIHINHEGVTIARLPERYLLYVGKRGDQKNYLFFVRSLSEIIRADRSLWLVCAGGGGFNEAEKELHAELGIATQVVNVSADNLHLGSLYKHALAFVFPSLYEGFGIPILEAFDSMCPVICSDTSSLPEVGGDAALYFSPNNEDSIRNAVSSVLQSRELSRELVEKGSMRLRKFSWAETAKKTASVYRNII